MPQRLTDMEITRVSLVDKGANQRRLAVFKRQEGPMGNGAAGAADTEPAGIAAWLRKAADAVMGKAEPIAKVQTFADIVAGQELSDALYDSWSTLQDAIWSAIYAYDAAGQPLSQDAKAALIAQDLDEFKAYLLAQMATDVTKSAGSLAEAPSRQVAAIVAKVGRKISGSRLERLQAAAETLSGVLAEVADQGATEDTDEEESTVEKNELVTAVTEAISKANEPIVARLEALEKAAKPAEVTKTEGEGDEAPVTLDTIAEAIGTLADRVGKLEGPTTGQRTSQTGQDAGEVKKRGVWAGAF